MKISEVKTFVVHNFRTNWVFVKIFTDQGIIGIGEGSLEYREQTVVQAIQELTRYLIGKDPFQIERHHFRMQRDSYYQTGPILSTAIGAVEIALWDIKGKALGVPVYELLGGLVNDRIRIYINSWFAGSKTPAEFAEHAAAAVKQGFHALKWDPFQKAYLYLSSAELDAAMANVAAVREAVGPKVDLLIEGHGRFNVMTAKQIAQELAPFKPYWFEEPVHPGRADALAQVRQSTSIPIAAGERCYSRFDCADMLAAKAVDILQPDVCHVGGLLEMKRIAAMADAAYVAIAPHNPNGPVGHAATLHFAASCPGFSILETMVNDVPWRKEITNEQWEFENGCFHIPNKPGLGLELNEKVLNRYPYEPRELRHYDGTLTNIRPPDACRWF